MAVFVARRLAQMVVVLFVTSILVFLVVRLLPGDPARIYAGPFATPDVVAAVRHDFGLNEPLPVQYGLWVKAFVSGDLGISSINGLPVSQLIGSAFVDTALLTVTTFLLALVLGVTLGLVAGLRRNSLADRLVAGFNTLALGVPNFWLGIVLILIFSLQLGWFSAGGVPSFSDDPVGAIQALILPTIALGAVPAAILARYTRAAVIETMSEDFIRTAAAKGMSRALTIRRHLLKHIFLNLLPLLAILAGTLLTGAALIEVVFTIPGAGRLLLDSVRSRDYAVLQTLLVIFVAVFLVVTFVADIVYGALDPRVRARVIGRE
jgi:peptide/nickel transport system permease protein